MEEQSKDKEVQEFNVFSGQRQPGEDFLEYRERLRDLKRAVKDIKKGRRL
jgi:hypothetical protein